MPLRRLIWVVPRGVIEHASMMAEHAVSEMQMPFTVHTNPAQCFSVVQLGERFS